MFDDKLVTVWSAPNYFYRCGNVAAILEIDEKMNLKVKKYGAAEIDLDNRLSAQKSKRVPEYFL